MLTIERYLDGLPHGVERMEQIRYAVLENHGGISIIPKEQ